ncbi:MAG: GNAT family N-acetyltransferase [Allosphingosinicella sp.]
MAEDDWLRDMAANRGCRLVKSRRRKPGGDYGRYGLRDPKTGQDVYGFGADGLTATAEEIEAYLRGGLAASWKQSLRASPEVPRPAKARRKAPPPPPPAPPPPAKPRLEVREAAPRDADAISALLGALGFPTPAADVKRRLAALRKSGEPPLVADEGGAIGLLAWHVTPVLHRPAPVGRVTLMVVAEKARGRGVGAALLAEAEAQLSAAGCGLVEVTSNIELGGAHAFYRAQGYERTSYRFAKTLGGKS